MKRTLWTLFLGYRMLGSAIDAEDLLQETFLHWQQTALLTIRSPRAFLITIVRNLCRNQLQSARVRYEEPLEALVPEDLKRTAAWPDLGTEPLREQECDQLPPDPGAGA